MPHELYVKAPRYSKLSAYANSVKLNVLLSEAELGKAMTLVGNLYSFLPSENCLQTAIAGTKRSPHMRENHFPKLTCIDKE
ncbi:hypothetical protein BDA96_01G355000 [Sorghum bicolor]|jgi:hypothetical protein|uniref:Uncharacterized protein n=2 Tax=Sorghum bicolor TaxID=4558 RepID=A0A921S202_SORBI|nr:hypothetical protein BDA96_01G355000 [Sorghum bicolor]OQU92354.1 hypothetical protein SORBI_3001G331650 [Sorghum bicolor]